MEQVILRSRRRRQPIVLLCIASPLILCLGWTALWFFAQREAVLAMDGWIANEAGHGREWTCPNREITGYPLQLRVTCVSPTYRGKAGGDGLDASMAGFSAFIYLYQPRAVQAAVVGPVTIVRAGDAPATLTWSSLTIDARILDESRARLALMAEDATFEQYGVTDHAAHAEIRVAPAANTTLQDHAYEIWSKLDQGALPAVNILTGEEAPVSMDEKGILTAVDPPAVEDWPVLVEAWRQAGGTFSLTSLEVTKGTFHAEAQGRLAIDDAHRLTGRLQSGLWGYEPMAARFGLSPRALSMGSILTNLLSGGSAPTPADKASIKLPITFSNGRVSIGPVVVSQRLAPLY